MASNRFIIRDLLKKYHFRGVTSMKFTFDPYAPNVTSIRDVLYKLHSPKITRTNYSTLLKVNVKSDRTKPVMEVGFVDKQKLVLKTEYLTSLQIIDRLWEIIDSKDPKKLESPLPQTKSTKLHGR